MSEKNVAKPATGKLLVASGALEAEDQEFQENNPFARSVVLLLFHDKDAGSLGLILTRPLTEGYLFDSVLRYLGSENGDDLAAREIEVRDGGPLETTGAYSLGIQSLNEQSPGIGESGVSFIERDNLYEATGKKLIALGQVRWGPDQLDSEIDRGMWEVIEASPELVFGPAEGLWEKARAEQVKNTPVPAAAVSVPDVCP